MKQPVPFDKLSEASGIPIADEAAEMMVTRYKLAAQLAAGHRTLEIACASGPGLRWLSRSASFTVGGDINAPMLQRAQRHYLDSVPLVQLSAMQLPFCDSAFDLVVFLEASYYVPDFAVALKEITRVLAPRGVLMFANANPERPDFIRSPFSHHYHSADQFREQLIAAGYTVSTLAAFPVEGDDASGWVGRGKKFLFGLARRILENLHLVPNTLEGRAKLKRLLGLRLRTMPDEIDESFAIAHVPETIHAGPHGGFKVIYAIGTRGPHAV